MRMELPKNKQKHLSAREYYPLFSLDREKHIIILLVPVKHLDSEFLNKYKDRKKLVC